MPVLVVHFVVEDLDDVSHGDHAHELSAAQDWYLGDMAIRHLAHDRVDLVFQKARHRVFRHDLGDAQPGETFSPAMDETQDIALAEDSDEPAVVLDDGQRTDVVLNKLGDRLAHGRITIDGDDEASLRLQDISNQHGTSPRYGACDPDQSVEIRPKNALDLRFGSETSGYRDILSAFLQSNF